MIIRLLFLEAFLVFLFVFLITQIWSAWVLRGNPRFFSELVKCFLMAVPYGFCAGMGYLFFRILTTTITNILLK